jgi:hypothetical protein
MNQKKILEALGKSWSIHTSSKWARENLANGQYSVTAIVLQEHFSGDILKTKIGEFWHFYNRIEGSVYDFTKSQFSSEITNDDVLSTPNEALADTSTAQYTKLSKAFSKSL